MTSKGPFQPKLFCDSMILIRVCAFNGFQAPDSHLKSDFSGILLGNSRVPTAMSFLEAQSAAPAHWGQQNLKLIIFTGYDNLKSPKEQHAKFI